MVTNTPDFDGVMKRLSEKDKIHLLHACMGMTTEVGEFVDTMKKYVFYGKQIDYVNLVEEVGDLFWYMALACNTLGVSFEEVTRKNIEKLKARYGDKFTSEKAIHRNLNVEKEVLER